MKALSVAGLALAACVGGLCVGAGAFLAGQRSAGEAGEAAKTARNAAEPVPSSSPKPERIWPVSVAAWAGGAIDPPGGVKQPAPSEEVEEPSDSGEAEEQPAPRAKPTFTELRDSIETEARDVGWGREVEARVRELMKEDLVAGKFSGDVAIESIACGSIRCAVHASATSDGDAENLGRVLTRGLRLRRGRVYHHTQEGKHHVEVIAAREGYDIFGGEHPPPPKSEERAR